LLAAWSQWQPHETIDPRRPYTPLVSVIIPGRNEAAGIVATLKTVLNSSYRHVEVIFIDNASTDNTEEVMQAFLAKYAYATANSPDFPVLYIRETREGKGLAMNTGIVAAHGELILTIDADSAMHEDCIAAFVEAFRHPQVMAGVGSIRVGNMQTWLGSRAVSGIYGELLFEAVRVAHRSGHGHGRRMRVLPPLCFLRDGRLHQSRPIRRL